MKTISSFVQVFMLTIIVMLAFSFGVAPAKAQQFNYNLCFATAAVYEQNYVYFHNTYHSLPPFPVCTYTTAQMTTLNAQLKAKYGY